MSVVVKDEVHCAMVCVVLLGFVRKKGDLFGVAWVCQRKVRLSKGVQSL